MLRRLLRHAPLGSSCVIGLNEAVSPISAETCGAGCVRQSERSPARADGSALRRGCLESR
jgi:hypothetical protein